MVVVRDSSEFIDGLPCRRFSGKGLLFLPVKSGDKLRSRSSSGERRRFCTLGSEVLRQGSSWILNMMSVHSELSSGSINSGSGFNAPPRRTVITRSLSVGYGGDEGDEAGAAEEFGEEDGGVALCGGGFNRLQRRPQNTGIATTLSKNPTTIAAHDDIY
ncbi:hypothetical protein MIMGU_mgv1a015402mg [Erythranthe guttata]|uniref:Uncharacterized protein n=1 Tax=Erythranthe guttata TaxID=4155 RepID=A0A022RZU2_ERYGU|nr:hypothetical protein MIMGU_mgv1a015402mg [Erythranthe guttata]